MRLIQARRLSTAPYIFLGPTAPEAPLGPATHLADGLAGRQSWTLVFVAASLEQPERRATLVSAYRRHRAAHPDHRVVVLCNTERELLLLQRDGVASILCNHNIFVNDALFTIDRDQPKLYDAIYNARMMAYKRHALARDIRRLALLYYDVHCAEPGYFESVKQALAHAVFLNEDAARSAAARPAHARAGPLVNRLLGERGFVKLAPPEVARQLNQARVGLCLSREEGAMLASMEYLLCGLPVVSTASLGGRELFFEPDFSIIVDDDPALIAGAVAELIRRNPRPEEVREGVCWKLHHEREKLARFVHAIFAEAGFPPRFEYPWHRLFVDSPVTVNPVDRLLAAPA